MSASVSVEVSLHQHLEVSLGGRKGRGGVVALTKPPTVGPPVLAEGSRQASPPPPLAADLQERNSHRTLRRDRLGEGAGGGWGCPGPPPPPPPPSSQHRPSPPLSAFLQDASVNLLETLAELREERARAKDNQLNGISDADSAPG